MSYDYGVDVVCQRSHELNPQPVRNRKRYIYYKLKTIEVYQKDNYKIITLRIP